MRSDTDTRMVGILFLIRAPRKEFPPTTNLPSSLTPFSRTPRRAATPPPRECPRITILFPSRWSLMSWCTTFAGQRETRVTDGGV